MAISNNRLIVVDDEPIARTSFCSILTQVGYNVRSAEDGFTALALMRDFMPDILLSDLNMPGMSGFELLSVVRRRHPQVHVIATSGAFSGSDVPDGVAADSFYEKATGLSVLFGLIKAASDTGRSGRIPSRGEAPIWTIPAGESSSREIYVLISCPDCLRAFPRILSTKTSVIRETDCDYCSTSLRYGVVRTDGTIFAPPLREDDPGTAKWAF